MSPGPSRRYEAVFDVPVTGASSEVTGIEEIGCASTPFGGQHRRGHFTTIGASTPSAGCFCCGAGRHWSHVTGYVWLLRGRVDAREMEACVCVAETMSGSGLTGC